MHSARVFHREADLEHHLEMLDFAVRDVPAGAVNLEPAQIADRRIGAGDGALDRIVDALLRRADDFDDAINMIVHEALLIMTWTGLPRRHCNAREGKHPPPLIPA